MQEVLQVAGGVLLAFYTLRLIDYIKDAPKRAAQRRQAKEFHEFMHGMAEDLVKHLEENKPKARRKPATKKVVAKKPVAKKGATNVKAKARR